MFGEAALYLSVFISAGLTALVAVAGLATLAPRRPSAASGIFGSAGAAVTYLFDGDRLLDATPAARALLAESPVKGAAWLRFLARFGPRFGDLESRILAVPRTGEVTLHSEGATKDAEGLTLLAEHVGGVTRITLTGDDSLAPVSAARGLVVRAQAAELAEMKGVITRAPLLIWRENAAGEVVWANAAYLFQITERLAPGQDLAWPLTALFPRAAADRPPAGQRQRLDQPDGEPRWYDLTSAEDGPTRLHYAVPADAAVQAETVLRDFMQTLTKTFAHLPIGLAVFDKARKLQLFNPALSDLTALPPEFLSARPAFVTFLDAMREKGTIPEPKDYRSWRRQMVDLETAASSGVHEETWSLPSGQTYRVIGRPHPNGAVALMFEDISTEILRTRRYRDELELGQAVLDMMEDGVAVFAHTGTLVMCNTAYADLWGHNPCEGMSDTSVASMLRYWRTGSAPTPLWDAAETYLVNPEDRDSWDGDLRRVDGRLLACRFTRISGGASMVTFRAVAPAEITLASAAPKNRQSA